ncbi:MAG: cell division protein FtsZ [Candidatus Lokiarchaeota archaeon]|nr:cell division protein FtsZ [Candidatus Lokiarchaeota archaeon]
MNAPDNNKPSSKLLLPNPGSLQVFKGNEVSVSTKIMESCVPSSRISTRSSFKELSRQTRNQYPNQTFDNDSYLAELLKCLKIKSLVVGVGGAGNNTVSRLSELGINNADTVNINTDAHDLFYSNANKKILIGKERCNGLGSGNDPTIGEKAAEEDCERLGELLNTDIVFLTCGLGGGTGTGAAPIIAREAKKNNAIVVSFCSIPFKAEGNNRRQRAKFGLKSLAQYSDTIIPIPNDNLLQFLPKAPMLTCFKVMDEVLVKGIRETVDLINNCGIMNIDFADIKKVFNKTGNYPSGLIGITESLGKEEDLVKKSKLALHNPLLKPNTKRVNNCLVSVTGDHRLSLTNVNKIASTITEEIPAGANLKLGTSVDPAMGKSVKIMVLGSGPISPYVRSAMDCP